MLKRILKESSIYSLSGVLTSVLGLLLVPLYTRVFTPADYGVIDMLAIVTTLANLTVALEVKQAIGRFTLDTDDITVRKEYSSTALLFTIITNSIFSIVALIFAPGLSKYLLGSSTYASVVAVNALYVLAFGIFSLLILQLVYLSKPGVYAIANIINSVVSIAVTVLLVLYLNIGVIGVFFGLLAGSIVGSLVALFHTHNAFALSFDYQKLREMLFFSIPLVPSSVGVFASLYVDRLAINHFLSLGDVGLYGVAYRFASMMSLFVGATQMAITPYIFAHYREEKTREEIAKTFRFFIAASLLILLGMGLFSKELLMIFTTPNYYSASNLIPLLAASIVISGLYVFAPGAWIVKKTKIITVINLSIAILNLALNLLLIPSLGILGAGISTLLSASVGFGVNFLVSQRYYILDYEWSRILLGSILTLVILVIVSWLPLQPLYIQILGKTVAFACGGGVIALTLFRSSEINQSIGDIRSASMRLLRFKD